MAQHVPQLVISAALHQVRGPEHLPDGLAERLGAVNDEQTPTVRPQTPGHQVLQQADGHRRVSDAPPQSPSTCFRPSASTPTGQHVVVPELDPVKVDHDVQLGSRSQLLKNRVPASMVSRPT